MSKPSTETSEISQLAQRLRFAISDLERAAEVAADAAAELREVTEPDTLPSGQIYEDCRELIELITAMHTDEHEGALRFCSREVCRAAWDMEAS